MSYADLHQRLLEQYAAPSVIVNEEHDILHLSERAGRYLQFSGGEPSHNLLQGGPSRAAHRAASALYQSPRRTARPSRRAASRFDDDGTRGGGRHQRAAGAARGGRRARVLPGAVPASPPRRSGVEPRRRSAASRPAVHLEQELVRAQDAAAGDPRSARHPGRGAQGVQPGAPGDERGAPLVGRGARDQQGGAAVGQRGADHRQPGAEDQGRGAGAGQQRHPEPDQLERYRRNLPGPHRPHQAVHAADARHLQPDPVGSRPAAPRHHQPRSSSSELAGDVERVLERLERVEREVRDPRWPLASDARCSRTAPPKTASTASC